ncbi:MAG: ABC transporter permease [Thermoguttaceae bacterium]
MKLRRLWAVSRKEFLHIIRDPRSLGMAIAIPMLMLFLYGYALTLDVDRVPTVVWDQSETALSRKLVASFDGSPYFTVVDYVNGYDEIQRAVDTRRALVGLVIGRDFGQRLSAGRDAPLQMIVDGSDSNTATIAIGYAEVITELFSQKLINTQVERAGIESPRVPVEVRSRVWFNAELQSKNFIIPGLIAVIMMVIAALLTSLTVAREWERGTMEQLISTPVKESELILGKIIPYFVIGMFDMLLAVLMGQFLFQVPLRGNVALLFGTAAIYLAGVLSLGVLISVLTKSQLLASQMAMVLTFLPAFLLSGFIFAISNMPKVIQLVTYVIPARYFVKILGGIYLKGVGLEILGGEVLLLTAFGAVAMLLAVARFKKKLV